MIVHNCIQGSPEWLTLRKGKPTASRFSDIITAAKGDLSKSATGYICELIGECFAPDFEYGFPSQLMQRGTELEPMARQAFMDFTGLLVEQVGFVTREDGIVGCSPDSLIRDDRGEWITGLEVKCPTPKVHVQWVLAGELPDDYKQQVHGCMAVTGLDTWQFFSYFPGMAPLHVVVHRDDYTDKLSASLDKFLQDYKAACAVAFPKLKLSTT